MGAENITLFLLSVHISFYIPMMSWQVKFSIDMLTNRFYYMSMPTYSDKQNHLSIVKLLSMSLLFYLLINFTRFTRSRPMTGNEAYWFDVCAVLVNPPQNISSRKCHKNVLFQKWVNWNESERSGFQETVHISPSTFIRIKIKPHKSYLLNKRRCL